MMALKGRRENPIERARRIMRYIHQHPGDRNATSDIAIALGIPQASVSKTLNKDFAKCFERVPLRGFVLTGEWPLDYPFDLELDYSGDMLDSVNDRPTPKGKWTWDQELLSEINDFLKSRYGEHIGLKTVLATCSKEDAEKFYNIGRTQAELFKRLLASNVIDTPNQVKWRPE